MGLNLGVRSKVAFILLLFFCSCINRSNLERALKLSGENRSELEKVLEHYCQNPADSLKLKAAEFLIEHMRFQYFFMSPELETYYRALDSIFSLNKKWDNITAEQDSLLSKLQLPSSHLQYISDLCFISSDFLIDNIDRAFKDWESPFAKNLSFDEFCEYLLPYRVNKEYPIEWRSVFYDSISPYVKAFLNEEVLLDSGLIWHEDYLSFDGKEFKTLPDGLLQVVPEFTVSCRVKPGELQLYSRVFDFGFDENYTVYFTPYGWDGYSMLKMDLDQNNTVGVDIIPISQFTHIALSWSNEFFHFYVDGVLKKKVNATLDMRRLVRNYIGKSQYAENTLFKGEIKDFRLYDRELNYVEVRSLAGKEANLNYREQLQETAWKIRDLYHIQIAYESLMPGGYRPSELMKMKKGNCSEYTLLGTHIFRSLGIPSGVDYTPQWADRSMGHHWNFFYTGMGDGVEDYSFSALWDTIGKSFASREDRTSKVFRATYAKQADTPMMNRKKNEVLPTSFTTPCIKDVSGLYLDCTDIDISLSHSASKNQHRPYLCNFNNRSWVPVHWGKARGKQAHFEKMGKNIAYLPAYFDETGVVPAGNPFILTKEGTVRYLIPDMSKPQKLILYRKYKTNTVAGKGELLLGGRFEVANKADFSDSVIIYEVIETPEIRFNPVELNLGKPYRCFRYVAPEGSRGDVSEIEVYGEPPNLKLSGKLIGNLNSPDESKAGNVFDGDPLTTYICNWGEQGCVGLDFGKAQMIGKIRFLPRNDDNFIKENENYELFYWHDKWISLGKQTGTSKQYLEYGNAPHNALFLLRNLTKGSEERIFTYEDGEQVWW